jgi:hypothetical protein
MPDPVFLSGDQVPGYLKGVELMTAGMEWQAMTGPVTITLEHLADAIVACNEDPHIQPPRIKLGHTSSVNGDHPDHDPFAAIGDAEPAFGKFVNLRATNDGAVLVGDADDVIAWLALSAPSTYPNRSSEATWQVDSADFDVQTAGGKRYSMVVTAVSLLGVYIPAISDLEDLSTLIMDGPDALSANQATRTATASLAAGDNAGTALSISEDEVRQRFNWEWAMDSDNGVDMDTYWWWCREIRVESGEVIADDDEGHLWQVPFTETDGVVTFAEPQEVRKTYIPVAASTTQVACFARPSKPQRPPVAAGSTTAATERPDPEEGATMDEAVREFLVGQGHDPETATEAQINAAEAYVAAFPPTTSGTTDDPETPETPEAGAEDDTTAAPEAERVPVAASAAQPRATSLTISVDRAQWEATQREIELSRTERRNREREQLDATASAAVTEGRIAPSVREAWRAEIDPGDNPDAASLARAQAAQAALAALPAGRVPLDPNGVVPDPSSDVQTDDDGLLPDNVSLLTPSQRAELRARRRA